MLPSAAHHPAPLSGCTPHHLRDMLHVCIMHMPPLAGGAGCARLQGGQVPPEWQAKVLRYEELERQVDRLLAHRPLKH